LYSRRWFLRELEGKDSQERAMKWASRYFAFTYRFSLMEERAGETRADESSS
jgi:hypothetical protein